MDLFFYTCPPFKLKQDIPKPHTGFINRVLFTPTDNYAHFIAASADKTVSCWSTDDQTQVFQHQTEHTQGINDMTFTQNDNEFITISSDQTIRKHTINYEEKKLDQVSELTLRDFDKEGYADNVQKQ
jgi:WD40 repeat protein